MADEADEDSTLQFLASGAGRKGLRNFVVPHGGSWYWNNPGSAPVGQNSSGYTYTGTYESLATTTSPSGPWTSPAGSNRYSVSVNSSGVPEIDPSGVASALALVAGAFSLLERRRVKPLVASLCG